MPFIVKQLSIFVQVEHLRKQVAFAAVEGFDTLGAFFHRQLCMFVRMIGKTVVELRPSKAAFQVTIFGGFMENKSKNSHQNSNALCSQNI